MNLYFAHPNSYFPSTLFHKNEHRKDRQTTGDHYMSQGVSFLRLCKEKTEWQVDKAHKCEKGTEYR